MSTTTDTAAGRRIALRGRVVTMNAAHDVVPDGVVYIADNQIVGVGRVHDNAPAGFEQIAPLVTGGTIYPGLIELHNHLSYDVLPLWDVPKKYSNRDQWGSPNPEYHQLISGPMQVIGSDPRLAAAVVRYVEVKCLLGGTTTSQGIRLFSDPGIVKQYRGLVRNVEATGDPALQNATAHIADVVAKDADAFLKAISGHEKMILHLAEGTDDAAHEHFQALQVSRGKWAITPNLVGIHCVALTEEDFGVMAAHGAGMVWSPFSNLLLYGQTAKVDAAAAHGVPIALGSDWSPSGSKNLLDELKVARLASQCFGFDFTDEQLVAMATETPAKLLGWQGVLGAVAPSTRADLVVVRGNAHDAYTQLVDATERDLALVLIDGVARMGTSALMTSLAAATVTEKITVGGEARTLNLREATADPTVAALTLGDAAKRLREALADLPKVAERAGARVDPGSEQGPKLAIEGLVDSHTSERPHLLFNGRPTGPGLRPVPHVRADQLVAIRLDPLTAADDPNFSTTIRDEANLPQALRDGLAG